MNSLKTIVLIGFLFSCTLKLVANEHDQSGQRQHLTDNWLIKSSVLVPEDGARISTVGYKPQQLFKTSVPSMVLTVLVRNGVYPNPRFGLNTFRIPDSSDEFNKNMNLIYFEDIPNPPECFLEIYDRYGILFGNCFYACSWMDKPGRPKDLDLLERCTVDLLKRYRNHPSLVIYMSMDEGFTRPEVYSMWRKHVIALDGSRFWIPSGYLSDFIKGESTIEAEQYVQFREDLPTGKND